MPVIAARTASCLSAESAAHARAHALPPCLSFAGTSHSAGACPRRVARPPSWRCPVFWRATGLRSHNASTGVRLTSRFENDWGWWTKVCPVVLDWGLRATCERIDPRLVSSGLLSSEKTLQRSCFAPCFSCLPCQIESSHNERALSLAHWVKRQRRVWKPGPVQLSQHRVLVYTARTLHAAGSE